MHCPFCHTDSDPIAVAGHIQCSACQQVIEGCCSGEGIWIEGENSQLTFSPPPPRRGSMSVSHALADLA